MRAVQSTPIQNKFPVRENEPFYVRIPESNRNKLSRSSQLFNSQPIPMPLGINNEQTSQNFGFVK